MKKLSYVYLAAAIAGAYLIVRAAGLEAHPVFIKAGMVLALGLFLGAGLFKRNQGEPYEALLWTVMLCGMVMRIGYMLYTGCNVRSHDLWELNTEAGGHAGYLLGIMENGRLPKTNFRQYYQQPFYYLAGSVVSGALNGLLKSNSPYDLVDGAKTVSCFASCGALLAVKRLFGELGLKKKPALAAMSVIAFHPAFYLTGGRVNCDALTAFFLTLTFSWTLYWYREASWKNTLCLAVLYGLGMMTKISCATMALFTAAVFAKVMWEEKRGIGSLLYKYLVFGLISFPLGLWYSVRNYRLFGQSFSYVLEIPRTSKLYCGDHSLVGRFFSLDIKNLFSTPYADPWTNYNYPLYMVKTSLFGEFTYHDIGDLIPVLLLFSALGLAGFTGAALIWILRKRKWGNGSFFAALVFLLFLISSICFCCRYPVGCSMDFRYLVILVVLGAMLLGEYCKEASAKVRKTVYGNVFLFSVLSCLMYLVIY